MNKEEVLMTTSLNLCFLKLQVSFLKKEAKNKKRKKEKQCVFNIDILLSTFSLSPVLVTL